MMEKDTIQEQEELTSRMMKNFFEKMVENDPILEVENETPKRLNKTLFSIIIVYFSLCASLFIFSSYHYPSKQKILDVKFENHIKFQLNSIIELNESVISQNINDQVNEMVVKFYENRNYKHAWIDNYQLHNNLDVLINMLDSAKYYGFPYDYFSTDKLKHLKHSLNKAHHSDYIKTLIDLELTATYASIKFMVYLNQGIVTEDSSPEFETYLNTLPNYLSNAIKNNTLRENIIAVQPSLLEHKKLLQALSSFIDLGLSITHTTPRFISDKLLAKSLYYSGITENPEFDSFNTKTLALFKLQEKHNLRKDPILNDATHKILVDELQEKYYLACLNLHRLRKVDHSGENYLFVNIPEYKLHVIEGNKTKDIFNVIVGKTKTPTPTLSSDIVTVIANPYWTVPQSILTNEMIHRIRRDSTYLKRNGYYIINNYEETVSESEINWSENDPLKNGFWVRQTNSKHNALGQVKFVFPNNYNVYVHDTPSKGLFKNTRRTYSHGCIRLENPDKLAQYLSDKYCTKENINFKQLISNNERTAIRLSQKVKIHIQYLTCSVNEENGIVFHQDIYNKDKEEINAIFQSPTEELKSI